MRVLPGLLAFLALVPTARAQTPSALRGRIVDASSGDAVAGARVTLVPAAAGLLPSEQTERYPLAGARGRVTDAGGAYAFGELAPGHYRLLVGRIGYRPASVDLRFDGAAGLDLSFGLSVAPIRLEPLVSVEPPADMYSDRVAGDSTGWTARSREQWRRNAFAATDVRAMGESEVDGAITLGERDVFRALRRFPGVGGRDDWSAEPWVRGAPAGHTRVYFDEIPVFNALHSGGLSTAIDPDALSAVFLHPSIRPPSLAEGAAAVLDLRSRAASGSGQLDGRVSVNGSRVAASLARRWLDGRVGVTVTGSRAWSAPARDLVSTVDGRTAEIPNAFADLVVRSDVVVGPRASVEMSGFWQRDWIDGYLAGGPANNRAGWGSSLGRITLQTALGSGWIRQTAAVSRYGASVRQIEPRTPLAAFDSLPTQEPTDNALWYLTLMGEWVQDGATRSGEGWRLGYELGQYRVSYRGAPPTPYSVLTYLYTLEVADQVSFVRIWAERAWQLDDDWYLRAGVRGEHYAPGAGRFVEPYGLIRHDLTDRLRVSLSTARFVQYAQPLAPSGLHFGPELNMGPVWLLAPSVGRALVSDVTTVGAEYWIDDDWLSSLHVYGRETDGIAIPDPRAGSTDDDEFLVHAGNDAWGTEVSVRKLAGSWTGSVAYTLGFATYSARGSAFPAPTDRRHMLDLAASTELAPKLVGGTVQLGAAVSVASGAPYTRIHPGWYDCRAYTPGGHCNAIVPTTVEEPNAERAPWSSGTNVRVEWNRALDGWRVGLHVQLLNALGAKRQMTYAVDTSRCRRQTPDDPLCGPAQDAFLPGMPRHVEAGLRVVF